MLPAGTCRNQEDRGDRRSLVGDGAVRLGGLSRGGYPGSLARPACSGWRTRDGLPCLRLARHLRVAHIVKAADGPRVTVQAGRYPLMGVPVVPQTVTVVTGEDDSRYYLATTSPDRAAAKQFLKVLRTAHAEPWPGTPGEFLDLRNWLLATRPVGLFTAKTELGEGIGLALKAATSHGDAARHDGAPEVVMVTAAHYLARPAGSPTAFRLVNLMSDWRNEGYTTTNELDAVLLRSGDSFRVRLDD
jgi:hypothetical protein